MKKRDRNGKKKSRPAVQRRRFWSKSNYAHSSGVFAQISQKKAGLGGTALILPLRQMLKNESDFTRSQNFKLWKKALLTLWAPNGVFFQLASHLPMTVLENTSSTFRFWELLSQNQKLYVDFCFWVHVNNSREMKPVNCAVAFGELNYEWNCFFQVEIRNDFVVEIDFALKNGSCRVLR